MEGDEREVVQGFLEGLEPPELARRLLAVADRDDAFRLSLLAEARAAGGDLDVGALKKELTARLRISGGYDSWYRSREYAVEVDAVLDLLDGLLASGHGDAVVALAEHVIKRLDTAMSRLDDSGGYLALPIGRVADIHCARAVARPGRRRSSQSGSSIWP